MDKQLAVVPREESRAVVLSGLSAVVHLVQIQIERRAVPSQICLESPQARWVAGKLLLPQWAGGLVRQQKGRSSWFHMGREHASREKKLPMVNFLIFVQKNVSTIRFQEIKIRPFQDFEKKAFFSLFLMRKRLSSGQKWFLRPYFPLIRGMFLLKSGLWFSFRALEVPEPRVRKRPY